ncbi:MAG TPA: hypothetical protein VKA10_08070, partial [Prolixibacteraceae bacterium]|nr:hypothetical protein [Prolixibacteraceae bacterium]
MHSNIKRYYYLFGAIIIFVVAAIIENSLLQKHPETHLVKDFQYELKNNEKELENYLDEIVDIISSEKIDPGLTYYLNENNFSLEEKGFAFLFYRDGNLDYWTDRSIAFYGENNFLLQKEGLIQMPNGYYLVRKREEGDLQVYGFHLIKHSYRYENKYLDNSFFSEYELPPEYQVLESQNKDAIAVFDAGNEFLFSIQPVGDYLCTTRQLYFPGVVYLIGLILLLYYFRQEFISRRIPFFMRLLILAGVLLVVYWLHLFFLIPKVFFLLPFFSPEYFAISSFLPSLGDFTLLALFYLFWMYNFGKGTTITRIQKDSLLSQRIISVLLLVFGAANFLLTGYLIKELIFNSTISFSLNRIIDVTAQTGVGIFAVGLLLLGVLYSTIKIIDETRRVFSFIQLTGVAFGTAIILAFLQIVIVGDIDFYALAFFISACLLAWLFSKNYLQKFTLSYLIIFVALASAYSLVVIYETAAQKEREHQKLLAVTLVADRDSTAEVCLSEIQQQLK